MMLRELTGYVAQGLLAVYWLWVVARTAPLLRKRTPCRHIRMQILLINTAGVAIILLGVGVIHFWATEWWQTAVAVLATAVITILLQRAYRRVATAPRHRRALVPRARRFELGEPDVRTPPRPWAPQRTSGAHERERGSGFGVDDRHPRHGHGHGQGQGQGHGHGHGHRTTSTVGRGHRPSSP